MVIREFGALEFRNYREVHVSFSDRINLLVGANGQGKTNLAEGLYFLCHLASFRTHRLDQLLAFGQPTAHLQGAVLQGEVQVKARVELSRRGRRVWLDDEPVPRLSAYISKFYAFLFNPERLYDFRSQPQERRQLFDRFISFRDRDYVERLRSLRHIHSQKNSLLKSGQTAGMREWNDLFIQASHDIIKKRAHMVAGINRYLAELHGQLGDRELGLKLEYRPSLKGDLEADHALLERVQDSERQAGYALYGPHRDDYRLTDSEGRKDTYFSQGEYRLAAVALMLALNAALEGESPQHGPVATGSGAAGSGAPGAVMGRTAVDALRPVIILDDLYSELDEVVSQRLNTHLAGLGNQVFITATRPPADKMFADARIMEIRQGSIHSTQG